MFLIRQAGPADFSGLFPLARLLDSYNLPADQGYIRELLACSQLSFAGQLPKARARYLFVLEDPSRRRVVGCSLIVAKHGTPGRPHLWFAQERIVKYSRTLRVRKTHPVLRMGWTENGPTEVGGLVLLPGYRRHPLHCGLQISAVRFLYMAIHPERFEREVLIEYRGAMGRGNRSTFWESVGRLFTGLSYKRADRLSVTNKEFIRNLLPTEPIYCALLPGPVQRAIGAIHPSAQRAAGLAARMGFRRIPQVEPFDGGPYYSAAAKEIRPVGWTQKRRVLSLERKRGSRRLRLYLVGSEEGGRFEAAMAPGCASGGDVRVGKDLLERLNLQAGDRSYVCAV